MYGSATAAIEVSSTSINVASITARAMSHGLVSGREIVIAPSVSELAANASYTLVRRSLVAVRTGLKAL